MSLRVAGCAAVRPKQSPLKGKQILDKFYPLNGRLLPYRMLRNRKACPDCPIGRVEGNARSDIYGVLSKYLSQIRFFAASGINDA